MFFDSTLKAIQRLNTNLNVLLPLTRYFECFFAADTKLFAKCVLFCMKD